MKLYDPKLRDMAVEFRALCKKYDCMAAALFVSPTHSEFVNELSSSWSVARMESANEIRFRSKKEDFPSREAQKFATDSTVHAITSIVEWSRMSYRQWDSILSQLRKHMTIIHKVWGKPDSVPGDGT